VLIDTLRAWFAAGGSASEVGRTMFCHRNTVRNRLARVERLTHRSLADPDAASELRVALEAASLLILTAQQRIDADPAPAAE
jgi:DNA-binding PucR family transcriptional regulator